MNASSASLSASMLYSTAQHSMQAVQGASAPVLVTEILTTADSEYSMELVSWRRASLNHISLLDTSDVSVCLSPNGWAWLVHGRRLLVWRYQSSTSATSSRTCRELTLPPSDLSHHARLVNVVAAASSQTPACLAVSPEGTARYWPCVAHETSSVELAVDLDGQECCSLTDLHPVGSVLATTTSTVVLISAAGEQLECRALKVPQGLLGGIGRRVSSLFWGGGMSSGGAEAV